MAVQFPQATKDLISSGVQQDYIALLNLTRAIKDSIASGGSADSHVRGVQDIARRYQHSSSLMSGVSCYESIQELLGTKEVQELLM